MEWLSQNGWLYSIALTGSCTMDVSTTSDLLTSNCMDIPHQYSQAMKGTIFCHFAFAK